MKTIRNADRPAIVRRDPLPSLQRLVDREAGSEQVTILVNKLAFGQCVPEHVHEVEEILLIIEGECLISVGDETATLYSGDAVVVPPTISHSIQHSGNGPAAVIGILSSPDAKVGFPE
jgi:mannose-6-phosphate isomerase-like protein (cupin superfamily)